MPLHCLFTLSAMQPMTSPCFCVAHSLHQPLLSIKREASFVVGALNILYNTVVDKLLCFTGSAIYPGSVVGNTSYPSLPCLQTPASTVGVLPTFNASAAPQAAQLPLFPNMYSTFNPSKDQAEGLSRGSSIMSNLSCATAQPQLSSECLSSTNSEDSLLNGLTSSPCYQSSYTSGYMNPFQAPNSPTRMPVSSSLGNSALLEQTAAMMTAATAALQSLQSPPQLYHSPQRQQPTEPFTSGPTQQAQHPGYAPQAPAMHAMPVQTAPAHNFLSVQTAPSVSSIGMQALEELMMSDSSQDSSSFTGGSTLHSVQSAPASFYAQATQPWCPTQLSCPSQAASAQPQQEPAAQHSMGQAFENVTHAAQHDATPAAAGPAPAKMRALKRSVSDIPVFDCKAAAAAMAAREAAKAELAAVEATQAAEQEAELADLDLPLLDDCFLADMGSSDMDSDLTSGLCFGGFGDFEEACPGIDRSDSSSNLLADQALQLFAEQAPLAAPKRKGKQSKKLKARGGVNKASAQVILPMLCLLHFNLRLCSAVVQFVCFCKIAVPCRAGAKCVTCVTCTLALQALLPSATVYNKLQ